MKGETDHSMFAGRAWDACWQNMVCLLAEADHGMSADRSNQEELVILTRASGRL